LNEIDDLQLGAAQPDDDWVAGDLEVGEDRPNTALRSDAGACGLLTAIAVLVLSDQPASEPAPIEQLAEPTPVVVEPPVPIEPTEPTPAASERPKPIEKPTLAATSRAAATTPPPIKKAPPVPAAAVKPATPPPSPAAQPATPKPEPAPEQKPASEPVLPAEPPSIDEPAAELPDVEGWDEADAAIEQELAG
jgi:hypothetical protein